MEQQKELIMLNDSKIIELDRQGYNLNSAILDSDKNYVSFYCDYEGDIYLLNGDEDVAYHLDYDNFYDFVHNSDNLKRYNMGVSYNDLPTEEVVGVIDYDEYWRSRDCDGVLAEFIMEELACKGLQLKSKDKFKLKSKIN
jgi:hypothetical protein